MSGKSLTEHITDLITKSLSENEIKNSRFNYDFDIIEEFEKRFSSIESKVSNLDYLCKDNKLFSDSEALNCTKFMRGFFENQLNKRGLKDKKQAFNDLLKEINIYNQLSEYNSDRLKVIMISDKITPWTGKELNDLTGKNKCNCPIRKGLISWARITDCPSQQEICEKGEKLLPLN
tara:strand:- start:1515 stop:2042 length:528 start_codon:yes stop_codon:yes gene_type:complete